jgi:DNA modification methylase
MNVWHPGIPEHYRNQIVTGDARQLAEALPDESVDLIFTDPVYWQVRDYAWLSEVAARVLKPNGALLAWQGVKWLDRTMLALMSGGLTYRWTFSWYQANRRGHADFGYPLWTPLLWFEKGKSKPRYPVQDIRSVPFSGTSGHAWQKQESLVSYWLDAFTLPGAVVLEPFCGGGSTPAVCRQLGRNYVAFEINADTAEAARERVRLTPMPLLIPDADCEPQLALLGE